MAWLPEEGLQPSGMKATRRTEPEAASTLHKVAHRLIREHPHISGGLPDRTARSRRGSKREASASVAGSLNSVKSFGCRREILSDGAPLRSLMRVIIFRALLSLSSLPRHRRRRGERARNGLGAGDAVCGVTIAAKTRAAAAGNSDKISAMKTETWLRAVEGCQENCRHRHRAASRQDGRNLRCSNSIFQDRLSAPVTQFYRIIVARRRGIDERKPLGPFRRSFRRAGTSGDERVDRVHRECALGFRHRVVFPAVSLSPPGSHSSLMSVSSPGPAVMPGLWHMQFNACTTMSADPPLYRLSAQRLHFIRENAAR